MRKAVFRLLSLPFIIIALALGVVLLLMSGEGAPRRLAIAFNKRVLNPGMLWLGSRCRTSYAAVRHVGRRSGRTYTTPVVAKLVGDDTVVIPLPYGPETDWCRNVLAAGGGTMTLQKRAYRLSAPEVIDAAVGERLVPNANAWIWHRVGVR
jgi:deazaflavin-dependent oxidoreductase (nitroreductase family)